jgi:hypothetical protein
MTILMIGAGVLVLIYGVTAIALYYGFRYKQSL